MKINWLWDSRSGGKEAKKILKDENHPKFNIYAEKLFSRISDPKIAFGFVDKVTFCKKWPGIKKRMRKDHWLKDRVVFWQTMYEVIFKQLKEKGIKLRTSKEIKVSPERMQLSRQIKEIRMQSGYTQKDIAEKLGVIQQYISKIENGRENFSVETLTRIADVLDKRLVIEFRSNQG